MIKGKLMQVYPKGPTLRFQFNPEQMTPSGGVGGWESIDRPRRPQATVWQGQPSESVQFILFFDKWVDGVSVEPQLQTLRQMGTPHPKTDEPPRLRLVYGKLGRGKALWVIDTIEWGEELRRGDLKRTRAEVTVTLLRHHAPDIGLSPVEKHKAKHGTR